MNQNQSLRASKLKVAILEIFSSSDSKEPIHIFISNMLFRVPSVIVNPENI